jgi:glycine dehydrogenase subunit 1
VVSAGVHPHAIESLETLARGWQMDVEVVALSAGVTELPQLDDQVSAVIVAQPNFLGAVERLEPIVQAAHDVGALVICSADPIPLGILQPPGAQGVDIVVGEGQTLGNRLDFGGPSFGFFAVSDELVRRVPGRIAGQTHDLEGKLGYVLTLQTREQHIRREKATSNICTAQALNALAGIVYLSWLGRRGLVELAELLVQRTAYARERLDALTGVQLSHTQPVVREFPIRIHGDVDAAVAHCLTRGINPGYRLSDDELLVAITERRSRADIDRLADTLEEALA